MAIEIELKAWVDDPEAVEKLLSALGTYDCAYEKDDTYWFPGGKSGGTATIPPSGMRIRREKDRDAAGGVHESVIVTYKNKEIRDKIEVNQEREFTVSDGEIFADLLNRLGLKPGIQKHKRGKAWICGTDRDGPAVRAELSELDGLGWFIELEILAAEDSERTVQNSRKRILSLLEKLKIPREKIETRPYTEMLAHLSN
jgi:adenylate cyclase class 2